MAEYCCAPTRAGICGKKLPCKPHPDQSNYDEPADTICKNQRAGTGAPGVCGKLACSKHQPPISKAQKSTASLKRKQVVKVSSYNKRRKVLDKDDHSFSKSIQESSEISESSSSSSEPVKKHKSKSKKHKKSKRDPIPLELAPPTTNILDAYALIEKERQKLLKLELSNSKKITKLIATKNNISDSSISSASDD